MPIFNSNKVNNQMLQTVYRAWQAKVTFVQQATNRKYWSMTGNTDQCQEILINARKYWSMSGNTDQYQCGIGNIKAGSSTNICKTETIIFTYIQWMDGDIDFTLSRTVWRCWLPQVDYTHSRTLCSVTQQSGVCENKVLYPQLVCDTDN